MARYKHIDVSPRFLAVDLKRQLLPGTFEHALDHLLDHEIDLSALDARFNNDETGASAYVPARPGCTTPHIRFLFIVPQFGLDFLQTPPRDDALVLPLAFGSAKTWLSDSHRHSYVPCPAHTSAATGARASAWAA